MSRGVHVNVVFISKYRRKTLYAQLREPSDEVFQRLELPKESRIDEGHLLSDRVHMLIAIPPKHAVSPVIGFIWGQERDPFGTSLRRAQTELRGPAPLGASGLPHSSRCGVIARQEMGQGMIVGLVESAIEWSSYCTVIAARMREGGGAVDADVGGDLPRVGGE